MLSPQELNTYRDRLHALRAHLDARVAELREEASHGTGGESAGGFSNAPLHPADLGSQETEEVVNIGLAENEAVLRQEIDDALTRLDQGKFGSCEECGGAITSERLRAIPYSSLCIRCASRVEEPT
jgi:RNA polymerase-binding protein DksA